MPDNNKKILSTIKYPTMDYVEIPLQIYPVRQKILVSLLSVVSSEFFCDLLLMSILRVLYYASDKNLQIVKLVQYVRMGEICTVGN